MPRQRDSSIGLTARRPTRRPLRGELWIAYTPGQPDDPHQPRPALVLSEDVRNRLADDVIIVPIFSAAHRLGPTHIHLDAGTAGLRRAGTLFCEEIATVDRDFLIRGPLGHRVSAPILDAVIRGVRRAVGDVIPEPVRP